MGRGFLGDTNNSRRMCVACEQVAPSGAGMMGIRGFLGEDNEVGNCAVL